jgi:hypothetical protein
MTYIDLINAFEQWLETNYLPSLAQLLWYKLIHIFNRAGWCEWVTVDNQRLMALLDVKREATFVSNRDKLIEAGLFEYQKGKKGSPNKYKICTVIFESTNSSINSSIKSSKNSSINSSIKRSRNRRHI